MADKIENIAKKEILMKNNAYQRKAEEYICLILHGVHRFERCGIDPIIVMSTDVCDILVAFAQNATTVISPHKITCCGYDVRISYGKGILSVAYDLLPNLEGV